MMRTMEIRQKKRLLDLPRAVAAPVFRQHGELFFIVFFNKKRLLAIAAEEEIKKPLVLKGTGFLKCRHLGRAIIPPRIRPFARFFLPQSHSCRQADYISAIHASSICFNYLFPIMLRACRVGAIEER